MQIEIRPVSGMEQLQRWIDIHNIVRPDDPETVSAKPCPCRRVCAGRPARELPEGDAAELRMVAVHPQWRARGLATGLLARQIADARAAGFRLLSSWVPEGGPVGLYEQLGFAPRERFVEYVMTL